MAPRAVSRCMVLDSGKRIPYIKSFKWNGRKFAEQIKYMDGIMVVDTIPDQMFSIDHVISKANPVLDHSDVKDKTYSVVLNGGKRLTFTGVDALEDGDVTVDFEKESVIPVTYSYENVVIE